MSDEEETVVSAEVIVPSSVSPRRRSPIPPQTPTVRRRARPSVFVPETPRHVRPRLLPRLEDPEAVASQGVVWKHTIAKQRCCFQCHAKLAESHFISLGHLDYCMTCVTHARNLAVRVPRLWCSGCYDTVAEGADLFHCSVCSASMCQPCFIRFLLSSPVFYRQNVKCPICKGAIDDVQFE